MISKVGRIAKTVVTKIVNFVLKGIVDIQMFDLVKVVVKNRQKFEEYMNELADLSHTTIFAENRARYWAALQRLNKCLTGFSGEDEKILIKEVSNVLSRMGVSRQRHDITDDEERILLCIGRTMGWGDNLSTIRTNFSTQIGEPLIELIQFFGPLGQQIKKRSGLLKLCRACSAGFCISSILDFLQLH